MKALTEKIVHYVVLVVVTIAAVAVMWSLSSKNQLAKKQAPPSQRAMPPVSAPKAPVAIQPVQVKTCEITSVYAGKIEPWETYVIGFDVGGRVAALGTTAEGRMLDEGDRVVAGQTLAQLDDRAFRAQRSEAAARVEQATTDLQRAQRIRQTNPSALSEAELQRHVTDLALAQAQYDIAVKNLDDATLRVPVEGIISKRWVKSGESVNPRQPVFELVENDQVLLIVDVPETHIRELETRMRTIRETHSLPTTNAKAEDREFRAHVRLEGRDRFGNPWPTLDGTVYRIPEVADPRTGLFPVEIRIENKQHLLRPGMVATADIVTAHVRGYEIPEEAVLIRRRDAHLFSVSKKTTEMEILFWKVGPTDIYRARQVALKNWIDQGPHIIVPADEVELSSVVVRGHFRLADQQLVRIVNRDTLSPGVSQNSLSREQRAGNSAER